MPGDPVENLDLYDQRYRLPSTEEDNPDDSDIPNNELLDKSTLFWSTQRIICVDEEDKISLGKPTVEYQMKGVPSLLRRLEETIINIF